VSKASHNKGDRVCEKNEESTGRGRSNIKKEIEGDKVTSR